MDFSQTQRIDLDFSDEESSHLELTAFKRIVGYLSVENEGAPATDFPLYEGVNIIGRVKESNVCIEKKALSKRHAVIQIESDTSGFIFDLGSINKTRKGKVVLKPNVCYNLENNDVLWFGNVKSHFKFFNNKDDDDETSEEETPDLSIPNVSSNIKPSKPLSERGKPAEVETLQELRVSCMSDENKITQLKDDTTSKNINPTMPNDCDSDEPFSQSILQPSEIPAHVKNTSSENEKPAVAHVPSQELCLPGTSEENKKSSVKEPNLEPVANFNLEIEDSDETGSESNFPSRRTLPKTSSSNETSSKILDENASAKSDLLFEDTSSNSSEDLLAELTNKVSPKKNFDSTATTSTKNANKSKSLRSHTKKNLLKPRFCGFSSSSSNENEDDLKESHQKPITIVPEEGLSKPSNLKSNTPVLKGILRQRPDNKNKSPTTAIVKHIMLKDTQPVVDPFAETQHAVDLFAETQAVANPFSKTKPVDLIAETQPVDLMAETQPAYLMAETQPVDLMAATQPVNLMPATQPVDLFAETQPIDLLAETQAINEPFKSKIAAKDHVEDTFESKKQALEVNSEGNKPVDLNSDAQKLIVKTNSDIEIDQFTQPVISYEEFEDSDSFTATPNYKHPKLVNMSLIISKSGESSVEEKSLIEGDQRTSTFLMPQDPCPSKLLNLNESEILCPESQPIQNRSLNISNISAVGYVEDSYLGKNAEKSPALFTDLKFKLNSPKVNEVRDNLLEQRKNGRAEVNISKISPLKKRRDLLESDDDDELPDISTALSKEENEPSMSFKIPGIEKLPISFTQEAEDDFFDIAKGSENKVGKPYVQKTFPVKRNPRARKTPKRYINDCDDDDDSKSKSLDNNSKTKTTKTKNESGEIEKLIVSTQKSKSKSKPKPDKQLNGSATSEMLEKEVKEPKTKNNKKVAKKELSDGSNADELTDSNGIKVFTKSAREALAKEVESETDAAPKKSKPTKKKPTKPSELLDSDVSSTSKIKSTFSKNKIKQTDKLKEDYSKISESLAGEIAKVTKVKKPSHLKLKDTNTDTDNDHSDNPTTVKRTRSKKNSLTMSSIVNEESTLKENYPVTTTTPNKEAKKMKLSRKKKTDNSVIASDSTTSTSTQSEIETQSNKNVKNDPDQLVSNIAEDQVSVKSRKSKKQKGKALDKTDEETVPDVEVEKKIKKRGRPKKVPSLTTPNKDELPEHVDTFEMKSELTSPSINSSMVKEPANKTSKRKHKCLVSKIELNEEKAKIVDSPSRLMNGKDRATPLKLDNTLQILNDTGSKTEDIVSSVAATPTKKKKKPSSKTKSPINTTKSKKSPLHQDATLSSTSDTVSTTKMELYRKRSASPDYSEVADCSPEKRAKASAFNVMFTGFTDKNSEKIIEALGGTITSDMHSCTHLVTDQFRRTCKLLCAVAKGIPVVDSKWIQVAKKERTLLDFGKYILKDKVAEEKYQFKMEDTLKKAAKSPLLKGWNVHVTSSVLPSPENMKDIIEASGAKFLPKMPKGKGRKNLVISTEKDETQIKNAKKNNIPIVSAEFLLNGLLEYKIDLAGHELNLSNQSYK